MSPSLLARIKFAPLQLWNAVRRPGTLLRAVPLIGVYIAGVLLLVYAPTVEPRPTTPMALYHAMRFFTLDAMWLPTPETPARWAALGWLVAFGAPSITAGVLIEGVLALRRSLSGPELTVRALRDHVIVCGYGAHGRAIASVAVSRGLGVVLVDRAGDGSARVGDRDLPLFRGDMTDAAVLAMAGLARARAVYFASGDPLMNLNGALVARDALGDVKGGPRLRPLVDDVEAERDLLESLAGDGSRIEVVDQFGAAAAQLLNNVDVSLKGSVSCAAPRVAILGFGRFGSALAREIFRRIPELECEGSPPTLIVVDLRAAYRVIDLSIPAGWRLEVVSKDVEQWVADNAERPPDFVFLTTSDDATNLRCAARLRRRSKEVPVVLRMLNPPRHLESSQDGVVARNIVRLFQDHFAARGDLR